MMTPYPNVMRLTQWDFNYAVGRYEFLAVFFFDPRCPVSLEFLPEYSLAATELIREGIHLAMIDVSEPLNKYLVTHYKVWRDPTVKIFKDGGKIIEDYMGPLDDQSIVKYLKSLNMPFPAEITSLEKVTILNKIVIVGIFPDFVGPEYEKFVKVAEKFKWDYVFYKYLSVGPSGHAIGFYNLFKGGARVFLAFVDDLEDFITDASPHVITVYNEHNQQFVDDFFHKEIENDKAILLMNRGDVDARALESQYRQIEKKYRVLGINFMLCDLKDRQEALLYFDFNASKIPLTTHTIVVRNPSREIYLKSDLNDIDGWLKDFKLGRVAKHGISEPIPLRRGEAVGVVAADGCQTSY